MSNLGRDLLRRLELERAAAGGDVVASASILISELMAQDRRRVGVSFDSKPVTREEDAARIAMMEEQYHRAWAAQQPEPAATAEPIPDAAQEPPEPVEELAATPIRRQAEPKPKLLGSQRGNATDTFDDEIRLYGPQRR